MPELHTSKMAVEWQYLAMLLHTTGKPTFTTPTFHSAIPHSKQFNTEEKNIKSLRCNKAKYISHLPRGPVTAAQSTDHLPKSEVPEN